jgi:hypothetical protein
LRDKISSAVQFDGLGLVVRKRQVNRLRGPARLALFQGDADDFVIQQAWSVKRLAGKGAKCFVSCGLFEASLSLDWEQWRRGKRHET